MDSIWAQPPTPTYHVLGVPVSDHALADWTKRLIQGSMALACILTARGITLMAIGERFRSTFVSMVLNISIPIFGYFCVRNESKIFIAMYIALQALSVLNLTTALFLILHASVTNAPKRQASGEVVPFEMTSSLWAHTGFMLVWAVVATMCAWFGYKLFRLYGKGLKPSGIIPASQIEIVVSKNKAEVETAETSPIRRHSIGSRESASPRE